MLRAVSLTKPHDDYYSGDPAFRQAPDRPKQDADGHVDPDALVEWQRQFDEHVRVLRVALETGNWGELLIAGAQPTVFKVKHLSIEQLAYIVSLRNDRDASKHVRLAFRAACTGVENLGDTKMQWAEHDELGTIAGQDLLSCLGPFVAMQVMTELGERVIARAVTLSPKS